MKNILYFFLLSFSLCNTADITFDITESLKEGIVENLSATVLSQPPSEINNLEKRGIASLTGNNLMLMTLAEDRYNKLILGFIKSNSQYELTTCKHIVVLGKKAARLGTYMGVFKVTKSFVYKGSVTTPDQPVCQMCRDKFKDMLPMVLQRICKNSPTVHI
ncbi:MAG: hypothetical protein ACJAZS_000265 [Alteromonas naphthalenivorans]|jgi:hypothetical protein